MIVSLDRGTSREDVEEFMKDYWVPKNYEFNIDSQLYEVFMRPFDRLEDL